MLLLQIKVDESLDKAIKQKAALYGVPASSLVRIVLVKSFTSVAKPYEAGNVFDADRDNNGKGIMVDDLIDKL